MEMILCQPKHHGDTRVPKVDERFFHCSNLDNMLFSALFALAILDALVNGPKLAGLRSQLVAVAALAAIGLGEGWGFLSAEVVLVLMFAEAAVLEKKRKIEEEETAVKTLAAASKPQDDNVLPPATHDFLKESRDEFFKNLAGNVNGYGQPWNVLVNANGVAISQSDFPKQKCKFWKVETEIVGDINVIKKELMDYDTRVHWDTTLKGGKIVKTFTKCDLGECFITVMYTAPAAGGMVSSRELVDLGLLIEKPGSFDYINCSMPKEMKFKEAPSKVTGERAFTHRGSGMRVELIPGTTNKYKYILVNAMDLGGWLPVGVINSATTGALMEGTRAMVTQLEKLSNQS